MALIIVSLMKQNFVNLAQMRSKSMQFIFNDWVQNGMLPDLLKPVDVTSFHKSEEKTSKKNYNLLACYQLFPKVFERLKDKQITDYIEPNLTALLCGFRKE